MRVAAIKGGLSEDSLNQLLPRLHELPFEARRKRMSTIHRLSNGTPFRELQSFLPADGDDHTAFQELAFVKGAPREVLELCDQAVVGQEICPLDPVQRSQLLSQNDAYARRGLRVLALAFRRLPPRTGAYTPSGVEQ